MKKITLSTATVVLIFSMLALTGCSGVTANAQPAATQAAAPVVAPAQNEVLAQGGAGALNDFQNTLESIYTRVSPSVVTIEVVKTSQATSSTVPGFPFFSPPGSDQVPQNPQRGLGSGFVWNQQGDIVTNNHVVEGASEINVVFSDGSLVPAKLVGADPGSDLAVIQVDVPADRLIPVQLADSTSLKVGQLAIAIGNPFGNQETMTMGIISALGRSLPAGSENALGPNFSIPDVIQTDAPVNPGNSGGVLLNDQGQVIGVPSALELSSGVNAGIGFAIPSAIVQKVVPALIAKGSYQHAWLGISGTNLTTALAQAMNLNADQRGALVEEVVPGSPADQAGLMGSTRQTSVNGLDINVGGDVIVAVDGQAVKGIDELISYLTYNTEVGQKVSLTILRNGQEQAVEVTLAARPDSMPNTTTQAAMPSQGAWLGVSGLTVSPAIAQAENLPADQAGVLVEQVTLGSPADMAGIRGGYMPLTVDNQRILLGGDILIAIDGQSVTNEADLSSILSQSQPGQQVDVTVLREGSQTRIPVTLGSAP